MQDNSVNNTDYHKTLLILLNNAKFKNLIKINIYNNLTNLKRLKDLIIQGANLKVSYEDIHIFNNDGIKIDSADVEYLKNHQLLYVYSNNQPFDPINYYNRFEILTSLKSIPNYSDSLIAIDLLQNKKVFIKKYNFSKINNTFYDHLKKKCEKFEEMSHENILNYIMHFYFNNYFYVVTEYANGDNLKDYLDNRRKDRNDRTSLSPSPLMSEDELKTVIKQIQDALKYCHNNRIAHLNLSLKKIHFKDDVLTLGSFYFCDIEDLNKKNISQFSFKDYSTNDLTYDLHSLGILIYYCLFGKNPKINKDSYKIDYPEVKSDNLNLISPSCYNLMNKLLLRDIDETTIYNTFEDWYQSEFNHIQKAYEINKQKEENNKKKYANLINNMGDQIIRTFDKKIKEKRSKAAFKRNIDFDTKITFGSTGKGLKDENDLNKYFEQIELEKKKFNEDTSKKFNVIENNFKHNFKNNIKKASSTQSFQRLDSFRQKTFGSQIIDQCITETVERHNNLKGISETKKEMTEEYDKYFKSPKNVFEKLSLYKKSKSNKEDTTKITQFASTLRTNSIKSNINESNGNNTPKIDYLEWINNPYYYNTNEIDIIDNEFNIKPILRKGRSSNKLTTLCSDKILETKITHFELDEKLETDRDVIDFVEINNRIDNIYDRQDRLIPNPQTKCKFISQSSKSLKKVFYFKPAVKIEKTNVLDYKKIISQSSNYLPLITEEFEISKNKQKKYYTNNNLFKKVKLHKIEKTPTNLATISNNGNSKMGNFINVSNSYNDFTPIKSIQDFTNSIPAISNREVKSIKTFKTLKSLDSNRSKCGSQVNKNYGEILTTILNGKNGSKQGGMQKNISGNIVNNENSGNSNNENNENICVDNYNTSMSTSKFSIK